VTDPITSRLTTPILDWENMPPLTANTHLFLRMEYLYTKFLLHKLLTKNGCNDREAMLQAAHELLDLALLRAKKRDTVMTFRMDIEWTVRTSPIYDILLKFHC
jgi:hypothetical protein